MEGDLWGDGRGAESAISIHTLRVEGDGPGSQRGRDKGGISIHTLRVEGDLREAVSAHSWRISIHTLRVEGDLARPLTGRCYTEFLSTPSVWRVTWPAP